MLRARLSISATDSMARWPQPFRRSAWRLNEVNFSANGHVFENAKYGFVMFQPTPQRLLVLWAGCPHPASVRAAIGVRAPRPRLTSYCERSRKKAPRLV